MIRNLSSEDERFLGSLSQINQRLARAQQQVSSGKKLTAASDDPDHVGALLTARADLARIEQIQQNLGWIKTEVDTAERSLSNAITILERGRVLGAQGVTGTQTAASRVALAQEVDGLVQRMANAANTYVNGRYIFAGDADGTEPFTFNAGPPASVGAYAGAATTRVALNPAGDTFGTAKPGNEIFTNVDPTKNAFAILTSLSTALRANDETAIAQSLSNISSAGEHMNDMLVYYGAAQNRVAEAISDASQRQLALKTQISQVEDADMTQAILEIKKAAFEQQTALTARGQMPRRSLFDYFG